MRPNLRGRSNFPFPTLAKYVDELKGRLDDLPAVKLENNARQAQLLVTKKANAALTLQQAKDYCLEALQWLLDEQVAASVDVTCWWASPNQMGILVQIAEPDGTTSTFGGGSAAPSAGANVTTGAGSTNSVSAYVVNATSTNAVQGAVGYAWYWGTVGSEKLGAITAINSILITTAAGTGLASAGYSAQFSANLTGLTPATTYFVELFGAWSGSSASATTTLQQMFLWGLN